MTERKTAVLFTTGVIAAYLFAVLAIHIAAPDGPIPPEEFPEKCPDGSSNCSMIGPLPYRSDGQTELRFNSSLEHVMSVASEWAESQPRTNSLGEWPDQHHFVFTSLVFRFPDDFLIRGFCDEGHSVIHVYSESRLGVSDFGVNEDRVFRFANHMSSVEMPTSECTGE